MSERRDFLKAAYLWPLGASAAMSAAPMSPPVGDPSSNTDPQRLGDPQTAPDQVKEQPFADYHLLGKPDQHGNLLGQIRPKNWKATKDELFASLRDSAQEDDPIHNWIRTFRLSIDERMTAIVLQSAGLLHRASSSNELKYEPQLYEISLRGASVLLDRCLRYRNEMGGFEIAGINAGISYLAFLKTKPLQRNLLIQSSMADIAELEQHTQSSASQAYAKAKGLDKLFEKYHLRGLELEAAGSAAEAHLAGSKDKLRLDLLERQFHIQIDAQLAEFTRLLSPGSSSNYAERYLRMLALISEDLSDAYCKLYSASKGIQQVLNLPQITVGLGVPIDADIPSFTSEDEVRTWVKKVVGSQDEDQRKPDILDAMVLWCRAVIRELDRQSQYESEFTLSIPLNQPLIPRNAPILSSAAIDKAFSGSSPKGKVSFALTAETLPMAVPPKNVRVIAIGLSVVHSQDDALPFQYTQGLRDAQPPAGTDYTKDQHPLAKEIDAARAFEEPRMARLTATVTTPPQSIGTAGSSTYVRPAVFLPNIRIQGGSGGDLEPILSFDPACRNLSPFGTWAITMNPNAVAYFRPTNVRTDSWIQGLILHLRLRAVF